MPNFTGKSGGGPHIQTEKGYGKGKSPILKFIALSEEEEEEVRKDKARLKYAFVKEPYKNKKSPTQKKSREAE
tara:strand:- start:255 stop:473 length:219 start_codon:yes stop_codon:yes gene_type:complete